MYRYFSISLINTIKMENQLLWNSGLRGKDQVDVPEGDGLAYAEDTMPRGVLGLNATMLKGYLCLIANRHATLIDLKKERNFFETRVTEYQTGGALNWD
jgi:ribonucleoside-diphosphate reductase beta chain